MCRLSFASSASSSSFSSFWSLPGDGWMDGVGRRLSTVGYDLPTCSENDGVFSCLLLRPRLLSPEPDAKGRGRRLDRRRLLRLMLLLLMLWQRLWMALGTRPMFIDYFRRR